MSYNQCCGAGRSRGFLAGAGADLKFELEPEPQSMGRLQLLFFASEKRNDLKIFIVHRILYRYRYIFLYNKKYLFNLPTLKIFHMFCIKICFMEPEPVGAELFKVEPEPKFFTWSRSRKEKISAAGAEEKWFGFATLDFI